MSTLHEAAVELFYSVLLAGEFWLDADDRKWFYESMQGMVPFVPWTLSEVWESREIADCYR